MASLFKQQFHVIKELRGQGGWFIVQHMSHDFHVHGWKSALLAKGRERKIAVEKEQA